jgi:hypothetical protein
MFFFCFCKKNKKKSKLKKLSALIEKILYNAKARADFAAIVPVNQEEKDKIEDRKKTLHKAYINTRTKILKIDQGNYNQNILR